MIWIWWLVGGMNGPALPGLGVPGGVGTGMFDPAVYGKLVTVGSLAFGPLYAPKT